LTENDSIIVNLSGRGDKDVELIASAESALPSGGART
jgi:tryptophan synthase beta subunit